MALILISSRRTAVCPLTCRNAACRPGQLLVRSHSGPEPGLTASGTDSNPHENRLEPPRRSEQPRCGVLQANRQPLHWTGRRLPRRPQELQSREVIDHMVVSWTNTNARISSIRREFLAFLMTAVGDTYRSVLQAVQRGRATRPSPVIRLARLPLRALARWMTTEALSTACSSPSPLSRSPRMNSIWVWVSWARRLSTCHHWPVRYRRAVEKLRLLPE
jgi:hypothetical protein